MPKIKLKRGQKSCKSCGAINAARQRVCTTCNGEFSKKHHPIKNEIKNWKELDNDTYVKVVQGTGPYFVPKRESEEDQIAAGDKMCIGDTGVYKVVGKDEKGIIVYGATSKNSGYSYLYMGEPYQSNVTGIFHHPYRLVKVKPKRR